MNLGFIRYNVETFLCSRLAAHCKADTFYHGVHLFGTVEDRYLAVQYNNMLHIARPGEG